jgi:hypothetical protein
VVPNPEQTEITALQEKMSFLVHEKKKKKFILKAGKQRECGKPPSSKTPLIFDTDI